jgi:hypothetical protein
MSDCREERVASMTLRSGSHMIFTRNRVLQMYGWLFYFASDFFHLVGGIAVEQQNCKWSWSKGATQKSIL